MTLPAGVVVGPGGVLCDESGAPLPRGLKFVDGSIVAAASGSQLPKSECSGRENRLTPTRQCVYVVCVL